MAVTMNPREKWTDERLDDLNEKVDRGFAELKAEMKAGFDRMEARFEKVDERFEKMDERFERMQQMLLGGAVAIIVSLIGSTATLAGIAFL
jgi:flagellar capping protein FliD